MTEVLGSDDLYTFIGGAPLDRGRMRERYAWLAVGRSEDGTQDWHNWIIRTLMDDRAVGTIQATVFKQRRSADIAWIVGAPWQGRGYASEAAKAAFDWLVAGGAVDTITAHVHPDHAASAKVAEWIGLKTTERFHDGERQWIWERVARPESGLGTADR